MGGGGRVRIRSLISLALLLGSIVLGDPVGAETDPYGEGFIDEDGDPTVLAGEVSDVDGGGGGGGAAADVPCRWEVVIEDDLLISVWAVDTLTTQHSRTGRWLQRICDGIGVIEVDGYYIIPEAGLVDPAALAAEALASIGIEGPSIRTSPSAGRLVVHVPAWLWVDPGWWQPYGATASAGRVTATVTARPRSTSWSTGDGSSLRCGGAGRPWRPGLPESATDCSHTYLTASGFDLSATVALEVTWTSNVGVGGALPAISRTSSIEVVVGEIQAIGEN